MRKGTGWITSILLLAGTLVCSSALLAQDSGGATKPLSRCDVLAYQSLRGDGQHALLGLLKDPGIAFDPDDGFLSAVLQAGGSRELVSAIRKAVPRHGPAQFPCDGALYGHVLAASSATAAGRLSQAETEWRSAVAVQPANPMLHLGLGMVLGLEKKWPQAEAEDRVAIKLDPALAIAHSRLAAALTVLAYSGEREKHLKQAHDEFETAIHLSPGDCLLRADYAVTLLSQRNYTDADKQLDSALRQCPEMTFPMYVRANLLAEQGRRQEAIAQLRSALQVQPENCTVARYLVSLLIEAGDTAGARSIVSSTSHACSEHGQADRQKH